MSFTIGVLGARGYVGKELIQGILKHPKLQLDWVSSRQLSGQPLSALVEDCDYALEITTYQVQDFATIESEIIVLALPNGLAADYVEAITAAGKAKVIIDLSADYRFDTDWIYSVPELHGTALKDATSPIKISNPGCYATAMQLAIEPIKALIHGSVHCFGISGYSGAGTKPGPNNDPERLKDNILPYTLIEHIHEREVARHSQCNIHFSPHVASFFRGINMTVQVNLKQPTDLGSIEALYQTHYDAMRYVHYQSSIPNVQQVVNTPDCVVGGISLSQCGQRLSLVSVIDNLAKGAASQAMQNINIALGLEESLGIDAAYL